MGWINKIKKNSKKSGDTVTLRNNCLTICENQIEKIVSVNNLIPLQSHIEHCNRALASSVIHSKISQNFSNRVCW